MIQVIDTALPPDGIPRRHVKLSSRPTRIPTTAFLRSTPPIGRRRGSWANCADAEIANVVAEIALLDTSVQCRRGVSS